MNVDREIVLEDTLQHSLTQMKNHTWAEIEALSNLKEDEPLSLTPESYFTQASQDLAHINLLNSMLEFTQNIDVETIDPKKCEDAAAFRNISSYFQTNANKFLRKNPVYQYDFDELLPEISQVFSHPCELMDDFLPVIIIPVSDYFVVKMIFSLDHKPVFIVVHSGTEKDLSPFEQSEFRIFRILTVYFSRALPDFMLNYKKRGIIEFIIWLRCYGDLYTTPCLKCKTIIDRDLTGDLLPPIVRTVQSCEPYHIKCAPFEIELPDFGYVTLISEDQMEDIEKHFN